MDKAISTIFFYEQGERVEVPNPVFQLIMVPVGILLISFTLVDLVLDYSNSGRSSEPWYHYFFYLGNGVTLIWASLRKKKNPHYTFVRIDQQELAFKSPDDERQIPLTSIGNIHLDVAAAKVKLKDGEIVEIPYSIMEYKAVQEFKEAVRRSTNLRSEEKPSR